MSATAEDLLVDRSPARTAPSRTATLLAVVLDRGGYS